MNFSSGTDFLTVRSTSDGGGSTSVVRSMVDTGRFRALRISADLLSKVSSSSAGTSTGGGFVDGSGNLFRINQASESSLISRIKSGIKVCL